MADRERFERSTPMASRWRRRRMCTLIGESEASAALREVSASGAFVETSARPPLGTRVWLRHPDAGTIDAEVMGFAQDGLTLRFPHSAAAAGFALAAIGADMTVG